MFKKLFFLLTVSLSVQNTYSMQGANAGLNQNPELNFDKIELALDSTDYLSECLKIVVMGSTSKNKLKAVYVMSGINKLLISIKEATKLNWSVFKKFSEADQKKFKFTKQNREDSAINGFIAFLISVIHSWWLGNIDTLGIFKLFSNFGYAVADISRLEKLEDIVNHNKNNIIEKLNQEKINQFGWLTFNKFLPFVVYTFFKLRSSDVGFSRHLFLTLGDQESKRASSLYRYCSLAAGISEMLRIYRQAKVTKIYEDSMKLIPKTS